MRNRLPVLLVLAAVLACDNNAATLNGPSHNTINTLTSAPDKQNRYIVQLRGNITNVHATADALTRPLAGRVQRVYQHALKGFVVELDSTMATRLAASPLVAAIERDAVFTLTTTGTQYDAPWGLGRIDDGNGNTEFTYKRSGVGVRVYDIDSGIRSTHQEFTGRVGTGFTVISDGLGTSDCNGHGTQTAGVIAGTTYGAAKATTIVPVRVFGCTDTTSTSNIIAGVDWVTANAIKPAVANMSLGGAASAVLDSAVQTSIDSGIVYVVAAGNNSGLDACLISPARIPAVITVAASAQDNSRASFSNIGSCVDIFAPGVDIKTATIGSNIATATPDGTSFSAPFVSGAASQYLEATPTATPAQVASALTTNALASISNPGTGSPNRLLYTGFIPGLAATISGPTSLSSGSGTWTATPSGGSGYSYAWTRIPCTGSTQSAGTTQSITLSFPFGVGADFWLKLVVTSGSQSFVVTYFVDNPQWFPGLLSCDRPT